MTYVWDKRTCQSIHWRVLEKVLHVLPSICCYCLSTCQIQVLKCCVMRVVRSWLCKSDCVSHAMFFVCVLHTVWDDPSNACCLQRKSRHVQVAPPAWSRCELQWTWTWIHSANVRWPVRYAAPLTGELFIYFGKPPPACVVICLPAPVGKTDITGMMLDAGAETDVVNSVGRTAAQMAAFVGTSGCDMFIHTRVKWS